MASVSPAQMTMSFEPTLRDRFPTLRQYISHRVTVNQKSAKVIAGDMDMAPSMLTRKLNAGLAPDDKDTQRFNLEDLELYLQSSGDAPAVIEYLASKYMDTPEARKSRLLNKLEGMLPDLVASLASLKETA